MKSLAVALGLAAILVHAQNPSNTAIVNLSNDTGTPQHLAAGVLYGIPNATNQIPSTYYSSTGLNYFRGGGAQVPAPGRGWIWGATEYRNRFNVALSDYKTARSHGMKVVFLIHDLWGADGTQNSSAPYPGDNNDWTDWNNYLNQFISDMTTNKATDSLIIDIWNEPDLGTVFWGRSQDQYLEMWNITYNRFRQAWGTSVLLSGPAAASSPSPSNTWWSNYMSYIATNNVIPDQWSWHEEGGSSNLLTDNDGFHALLAEYKLPIKPININEYATYPEQVPSGSTWWIAQLERINAIGLRGNWQSQWALHDFLAGLVSKPNNPSTTYSMSSQGYFPTGVYQVYQYYYQNMTGQRIGTMPSGDLKLDLYATKSSTTVKVLAGVRITQGTWYITINKLSSIGLPTSGSLSIHTWGFPAASNVYWGEVAAPTDLGLASHTYSGDSVTFGVDQTDTTTAYAFEFNVGKG